MRALAAAVLTIAALGWAAPAVLAENPCFEGPAHDVLEVRGFTWSGTITSVEEGPFNDKVIHMAIDHVFATGTPALHPTDPFEAGRGVILMNDGCAHVFGLTAGRRYLMSTAELHAWHSSLDHPWSHTISAPEFIAWELHGAKATVIDTAGPHGEPAAVFADRHTFADALHLVAPNAALPSTDTLVPPAPVEHGGLPWLPLILGAAVGLLTLVSFRWVSLGVPNL